MISTAAYYCTNGHVWESTTSTMGHDAILAQPCISCLMGAWEGQHQVHGPFVDMAAARSIAQQRGVQLREIAGEQETQDVDTSRESTHTREHTRTPIPCTTTGDCISNAGYPLDNSQQSRSL